MPVVMYTTIALVKSLCLFFVVYTLSHPAESGLADCACFLARATAPGTYVCARAYARERVNHRSQS